MAFMNDDVPCPSSSQLDVWGCPEQLQLVLFTGQCYKD